MAWLERFLRELRTAPSWPSPTTATSSTTWPSGSSSSTTAGACPFEGNYTRWLEQKQERLRQEEKTDSARQRTLERELEWVRMAPKARQAKGKARLAAYEKLLAEAKAADGRADKLEIVIPSGERLGDVVIEAEHLTKGFGDRLLIEDLSASRCPRPASSASSAPNGAGKTTLFRMITGQRGARRRRRSRVGPTVELAYVDQSRDTSTPTRTVYEEITDGHETIKLGNREMNGRAYVAGVQLQGLATSRRRSACSRAASATGCTWPRCSRQGGNVLLLDEPTNDLDVDTLRALEDGLESFAGCAVVISHDRWFLDRIATHMLAFEGDSQVRWFEGNFSEYEAFRHKELGADADQPHRIKYKPLVRGLRTRRCRRGRSAALVRASCSSVGIAGMIVGSIADNNGMAITFGLVTAVAAVGLILVTAVAGPGGFARTGPTSRPRRRRAAGALVEEQVDELVAAGADERAVRELVGGRSPTPAQRLSRRSSGERRRCRDRRRGVSADRRGRPDACAARYAASASKRIEPSPLASS